MWVPVKSCAFGPDFRIDLARGNFIIHKLYAISLAAANPGLKFMILSPFGTRRKTIVMVYSQMAARSLPCRKGFRRLTIKAFNI